MVVKFTPTVVKFTPIGVCLVGMSAEFSTLKARGQIWFTSPPGGIL